MVVRRRGSQYLNSRDPIRAAADEGKLGPHKETCRAQTDCASRRAAAAVLITLAATSMTSRAAGSYADDRSEIEDLQARYLFALDFHDPASRSKAAGCSPSGASTTKTATSGPTRRRKTRPGNSTTTDVRDVKCCA